MSALVKKLANLRVGCVPQPLLEAVGDLEREVTALREENRELRDELASAESDKAALREAFDLRGAELDGVEAERDALREENARLKHLARQEAGVYRASVEERDQLRAENARLFARHHELEVSQPSARILAEENDQLRAQLASEKEARDVDVVNGEAWCERARIAEAHVAALVKALRDLKEVGDDLAYHYEAGPLTAAWYMRSSDADGLLNAPDLAALVKQEQAREAVIAAAENLTDSGWHGAESVARAVHALRAAREGK